MNERAVANAQRIKGQNASNALSVFDDINIYRQTLEMASGLSRSFIVPKDFQNKPESCLIALDLARRLGVHVMTLFPHLYVVDSKPAFSTQFLISLVNSSGVFTRIEWDEGYDGEAEVTYSEWGDQRGSKNVWKETVPNYFAIARFQELSTGKKFESPRVDLRFAEQNGWTTKPGSKWRSMPQIMCAYRSASILIKRVCPEITLGLDFAEDLRDAAPIEAQFVARGSSTVGTEPAPVPAISSEVCDEEDEEELRAYLSKIDTAETAEALAIVGHEIKAARTWSTDERAELEAAYRARFAEVKKNQTDQVESTDDVRTGALRRSSRKAEERSDGDCGRYELRERKLQDGANQETPGEAAPEPGDAKSQDAPKKKPTIVTVQELTNAIVSATNVDALGAAVEALEIATAMGELSGDVYGRLAKMAEDRQVALEMLPEADDEPAAQEQPRKKAPSKKAQARYVDGLVQALADSTDSTACENLIKTADGYVANNLITKEAADEFRDKAVAKMKTFLI